MTFLLGQNLAELRIFSERCLSLYFSSSNTRLVSGAISNSAIPPLTVQTASSAKSSRNRSPGSPEIRARRGSFIVLTAARFAFLQHAFFRFHTNRFLSYRYKSFKYVLNIYSSLRPPVFFFHSGFVFPGLCDNVT